MGDITDSSFVTSYPAENVYGLGVAGPPETEAQEEKQPERPEEVSNTRPEPEEKVDSEKYTYKIQNDNSPAINYEEEVGRHVDIVV